MKPIRSFKTTARAAGLLWLGLCAGTLASCAHLNYDVASNSPLSESPAPVAEDAEPASLKKKPYTGSAQAIEGIPLPVNSSEGPVVANHLEVRQVPQAPESPETPEPPAQVDSPIIPASAEIEAIPPAGPFSPPPVFETPFPAGSMAPEFCPPGDASAGIFPAPGFLPAPPIVPAWVGGAAIAPLPAHFPDEYLCDGGDREYPVRYDADMRLGLDTEDTVVEYTDHIGGQHVKPTNRVCVYAPRFGAVRSVSAPILGTSVDQIASADKFLRGAGMRSRDITGLHKQNTAVGNYRVDARPSDIDVYTGQAAMDQTQVAVGFDMVQNTFQDFQFVRTGQLTQIEEVHLAKGIHAAIAWTRTQYPIIAAQTEQAQEVTSEFRAQEFAGRIDLNKPGRLRIVKLADKAVAQPGDMITFTIRYDNLGDLPLSEIRIIDNLTPRLQYVEDSETSDRAGRLVLQDNEEGSLILEFHLDEPLPGGQGGVVTFQARVR